MIIIRVKYFIRHIFNNLYLAFKHKGTLIFDFSSDISNDSQFEGANLISPNTSFAGSLGYGSYIGSNSFIKANIGRFTSIASYVRTSVGIHPTGSPFATTCPMFYSSRKQNGCSFTDRMKFNEITEFPEIGNDVWIGENVFIAGGVKIGDGAIVLAGAVVVKDVMPYSIVGGIPAKIVKYRYDEETIQFLLNLKWWDFDIEWLRIHNELMCDIEKLKSSFASSS